MKKSVLALSVLSLAILFSASARAQSGLDNFSNLYFGYQTCQGLFALCASSTCTPTGGTVDVHVAGGSTASFPAASCTCPVFDGTSIADVNGGNMHHSCDRPGKGK